MKSAVGNHERKHITGAYMLFRLKHNIFYCNPFVNHGTYWEATRNEKLDILQMERFYCLETEDTTVYIDNDIYLGVDQIGNYYRFISGLMIDGIIYI